MSRSGSVHPTRFGRNGRYRAAREELPAFPGSFRREHAGQLDRPFRVGGDHVKGSHPDPLPRGQAAIRSLILEIS